MQAVWLLAPVLLPFAGSILSACLPVHGRTSAAILAGAIAAIGLIVMVALYPTITGGSLRHVVPWIPELGLELTLRANGLSWLFSILVLGIGGLVVLYAHYYMAPEDPVPRFFSFLLAFMGSMLGLVLSGNLIQLIFFWELTSIFSFLLIGYWHHNQLARDGARMALIVTAVGGVSLLVGCLLLGRIAGSYDVDAVIAAGAQVRASPLYVPVLLLILLGAFTKSAQFPFHFWLPHAMAAPTPVSAYLHSATLVKAGIYVLMLLWPVLAGTDSWYRIVATTGLITLLIGAWAAIFQHDLKGLLAYSTISHLGLITLLLGLGSALGAVAAIFHTVNHAIFKASLFMAAGIIDHETGSRDLRRLSGLARLMPVTALLASVAAAAMAGVPLLNGFLSKEMFHAEALANHDGTLLDQALPLFATIASMFSVLYSIRFIHQTFFGPPPTGLSKTPHEAPFWMRLPVQTLVLICLLIGVLPARTIGPLLRTAVEGALGGAAPAYSLAIWHGFNLPLLMSVIAMAGGATLYALLGRRLQTLQVAPLIGRYVGQRNFEAALALLIDGARWLRQRLRAERLQPQLRLLLVAVLAAGALALLQPVAATVGTGTPADPAFALLWVAGAAGAIATAILAKFHRFAALVALGIAGLATCITFVWLAAPDLGLTQLLVEVLTLVLLLLGLRWLPERLPELGDNSAGLDVRLRRLGDLLLALTAGGGLAAISYQIMTTPAPDGIGRQFLERAYPQGGGMNVVNVILVDFRALDTLGEITVLTIAAIAVFTLLRRFRPAADSIRHRRPQAPVQGPPPVPFLTLMWMAPVLLALTAFLLVRGHNLPGGGFVAGVTAAITLLLLYMALGARRVEGRLHVQPLRWVSVGLLLAIGTGAGAALVGQPFLTAGFAHLDLGILGDVPLASALLFDLGVFAVVVGVSSLILLTLAHQSLRLPRARPPADGER